ncbi:MAG: hypothetical protein JW870_11250 [Candidatus Delongbacteria bacterium]|nr:hypothetical protein [Candidatus Delongbacteria bacterium]
MLLILLNDFFPHLDISSSQNDLLKSIFEGIEYITQNIYFLKLWLIIEHTILFLIILLLIVNYIFAKKNKKFLIEIFSYKKSKRSSKKSISDRNNVLQKQKKLFKWDYNK